MKRYRVTIDGRTYEVEVDDPRARPVIARIENNTFLVDVESGSVRDTPASAATAPALPGMPAVPGPQAKPAGEHVLTAPIPGTVVKVAAMVGKVVQRGDELFTIEAMKMFNLIRSPRAGTIAVVHVTERTRVAQGDLLVTFVS